MYINSFDDVVRFSNIRAFIHTNDIVNGKKYDAAKIRFVETKDIRNSFNYVRYFHYEVDSDIKNTYYDVSIYIENGKYIARTMCDCKNFRIFRSCEHIAAVFVNHYETIFKDSIINLNNISTEILNKFIPTKENTIKKELQVEMILTIKEKESSFYYYNNYRELDIKIMLGENKLYTLGNHARAFQEAYEYKNREVYFGKNFNYEPEKYYVSEENEVILSAYFDLMDSGKYFRDSEIKKFLHKLKNSKFILNDYVIDGIEEGFYVESNLIKGSNNYELVFDMDNVICVIQDDFEYILYKGKLYHLGASSSKLLASLHEYEIDKILIEKDKISNFAKGLLSVVKNNLNIDPGIDDVIIPKDVKVKLYFDLRTNYILVEPIFIYEEESVSYFQENNNILRDIDFENTVINDLLKYGFVIEKNNIILNDLELEVTFLEQGLEYLATKYEIFTTEKFKNMNIKKKTNITSMFGIGQDNILSYNFNLGTINSDELVNIFKEMKKRKKYYRLKNGDILSLEDESLKELANLSEELELTDADIIKGCGSLLKYRAIYLDSLKNTKYNIINTNNLFDDLIDKFYKYKDEDLHQDKSDLKVLRDYQLTGVKWLYNLAKTGFGGVLADEMGLGKTIQVIYYIKEILLEKPDALFLIVVPTSLAYNWDHEFATYGSDIKRFICLGLKDKRVNFLKHMDDTNVIITTYGLLREDEELYQNIKFHTMIIDEAQNIKNNMAGITKCVKSMNAEVRFALTGTPIENTLLELWSIFDFVMPGYLSSLTKFQTKYKIKDFNEESDALIKGLSKAIHPFILRRKKSDVIKELPEKFVNNIYIDLLDEQKKLYVAELERVKEEMTKVIEVEGISKARFLILQLLTKLRQICIDPKIIYENYEGGSNKIDTIASITKEYVENNHKILIFSSFKTALNIVKLRLNEEKIKTFMIDGSVSSKERMRMVDEFNESDDVKVFLIMLKSGGTGLNLASADVVIHLDLWWNPQAENQATDRAHRIGQLNTVEVIHLITKGTIEEKILELQNKKRILSDKLIDGEARDKNVLSELTKEDIENLLAFENRD